MAASQEGLSSMSEWVIIIIIIIIIVISGVRLSPLGAAATTDLLYQPQLMNV
jgi:hypothetical protein